MILSLTLPDDLFRQQLLQYLTKHDIAKLDNSCLNHEYRSQLIDKIAGVILIGDTKKDINTSLFKWLGEKRIFLINMKVFVDETLFALPIDYVNQFRYTQSMVIQGECIHYAVLFIVSRCTDLISIELSGFNPNINDNSLKSIAQHCTGLKSLGLCSCYNVTDTGLQSIAEHCLNLRSLKVECGRLITDASIIYIASHCTGLQSLRLLYCSMITDSSIVAIAENCEELM